METTTKPLISEEELIALLRRQDQAGVRVLYESYSQALYGVIFRLVPSEETANDLLQEAFVKIWQHFPSYDPARGRLYTWMLNIARNLAIDKVRSPKFSAQKQIQELDKSVYKLESEDNNTTNTDAIGLKEVVEGLKPEHKELIEMVYYNGYSQSEAAERLDIPLGTVKTRIRAALISLRKLIR